MTKKILFLPIEIKSIIFIRIIFVLCLLLIMTKSNAQNNWTLFKETSLRGSISGSITQGYIFKVSSNEFYVVNERNRQRVRVRNPNVKIFRDGSDYKFVIEDFDEPVICKKLTNVIETQINGEFKGWNGETIFKLQNGQIWQQASYAYMYQYAYNPEVLIYEYRGSFIMKVEDADETIDVKLVNQNSSKSAGNLIESHIDGEFTGWEGETIFKLQNGQIWQQASYAYTYHYAYNPKITIYKVSGGYEMEVDGISKRIKVKLLK